jgi:hypothetical protein
VSLDGLWDVQRTGGLLPPMWGVRKRFSGERGATLVGPLPLPIRLDGLTIRYRPPLAFLVDHLEPAGDGYAGRATAFGLQYGTFRLRRLG